MRQESSLWQFSELLDGLVRFHEAPRLACNVYIAPRDTCTQMSACLQCQYSVHRCHHTERPHIPWPGPRYSPSCIKLLYFRCKDSSFIHLQFISTNKFNNPAQEKPRNVGTYIVFDKTILTCDHEDNWNKHYCVEGLRAIVKRRLLNCIETIWFVKLLKNLQCLYGTPQTILTFDVWHMDQTSKLRFTRFSKGIGKNFSESVLPSNDHKYFLCHSHPAASQFKSIDRTP